MENFSFVFGKQEFKIWPFHQSEDPSGYHSVAEDIPGKWTKLY